MLSKRNNYWIYSLETQFLKMLTIKFILIKIKALVEITNNKELFLTYI